jgi:hypothetical protein
MLRFDERTKFLFTTRKNAPRSISIPVLHAKVYIDARVVSDKAMTLYCTKSAAKTLAFVKIFNTVPSKLERICLLESIFVGQDGKSMPTKL